MTPHTRRRCALIATQDHELLDDLVVGFEAMGVDVRVAPDGRELFLCIVRRDDGYHPPDLVVAEWNLPVHDGVDVVEVCARNGTLPTTVLMWPRGTDFNAAAAAPVLERAERLYRLGVQLVPFPEERPILRHLVQATGLARPPS